MISESDMKARWNRIERELANMTDVDEFINEYSLETSREQALDDDGWVTTKYLFMLECGGPTTIVDSDGLLVITWGESVWSGYISRSARAIVNKAVEYYREMEM